MVDGSLTQPDTRKAALAELAERGAHFVRMKLLSNGDKTIAESAGYTERSATLKQVQLHNRAKQLVAVVPASLGCVVVDIDRGGDEARQAVISLLGRPVAEVPTRRANGWHLWYRSRDAAKIGNGPGWRNGDIRGAKGQAILWHPEIVAKGLACTAPVADLMAVDLAGLPSKRDGGVVGERNNALNRSVFLATRNGSPIEPHVAAAREAGLPDPEIAATVASATAAGKRGGAKTLVTYARSSDGLAFCLDHLGIGLRLNIRAKRYEYRIGGAWLVADDERDAWLRGEIAKKFSAKSGSNDAMSLKYSADMFLDLRRALGNDLRIDPFRAWLEALAPWDGVPRIDGLLCQMFGADDTPLVRWASRYIGIGAIQRAFLPGAKIDEIPILFGDQGSGKSAFVRGWFSESQHEWHGDGVDLSARSKEQGEQLAGRAVCELSELAGLRKAQIEKLKNFITCQDDGQFRWAYARSPVPSPRFCVFVGTTNEPECLPNDPSGNRRFVVIELAHGCDVQAASVDRSQWWAEALARYHEGERASLPRDLHQAAADIAEGHRARDSVEEEIRNAVIDLNVAGFTLNELFAAVFLHGDGRPPDKQMQMRLSTALRNLGFKRVRAERHGRRQVFWRRG